MFYMGNEFNPETNKPYKTEKGGAAAAEKAGARLYDEDGEIVADYTTAEAAADAPDSPQDGAESVGGENVEESKKSEQGAFVALTDDVPDGATEQDGDEVKVYNESGEQVGTIKQEELDKMLEAVKDDDGIRVHGKVRRIFAGTLRIRRRPSWERGAVAGISAFDEKAVVRLLNVDGKPMYKTADGYFISGDPSLVRFIQE